MLRRARAAHAWLAIGCGLLAVLLHTVRCLLWGWWPGPLAQWVLAADAYVAGALLVAAGAWARRAPGPALLLPGAWGFGLGLLYRSLFEQLLDPDRQAGHERIVIAIKSAALVIALVGFVTSVIAQGSEHPPSGPEPNPG